MSSDLVINIGDARGAGEGTNGGGRGGLSRERILAVALSLVDRGGVASLSMRKLAESLGVKAMSLYNHVANKADIMDGLVELVASEFELPDPAIEWKEAMRRRGASAHATLLRHPWAPEVLLSHPKAGPVMLRYVDATLGCLRAAGFTCEQADHVWNALDSFLYGFTVRELAFPFEAGEYARVAREFLPRIPENEYPHFLELTRRVADGAHSGIHEFEFGLNLLLEGLRHHIA